jgi:Zn-dependent peptidase ImmA (M78 family)
LSIMIPYMRGEDIRAKAEQVLDEHWPEGGIPIEVEEIIEFGLGMEIRPVRALQARFDFEGAISYDLQTILVDEEIMQRYPNRYRFTIAHELGHRVLHGDFIRSLTFDNREKWKQAVTGIDAKSYGRLEAQAYVFAGYFLVPTDALVTSCNEAQQMALDRGIDLSEMGATAVTYVAGHIAKEFKVSTAVIERRLEREEIFQANS